MDDNANIPPTAGIKTVKSDCPLPTTGPVTTYVRALHRACLIVGGAPALAAQLKVRETDLRTWMEGQSDPPPHVFLGAVEVLLLHSSGGGLGN